MLTMSYVTSDCAYSFLKYVLINGRDYDQKRTRRFCNGKSEHLRSCCMCVPVYVCERAAPQTAWRQEIGILVQRTSASKFDHSSIIQKNLRSY